MAYLTQEERKQQCQDYYNGFTFDCIRDLSQPVVITGDIANTKRLCSAITNFIGMWMYSTHKNLNGFAGLDTIKYEFKEIIEWI